LGFWTTQSKNFYSLVYGVGQFLSGFIAPLALFPGVFQSIADLLPFRSALGLPIEILMGRLTFDQITAGLIITLVWTVAMFVLYRVLWQRGLKRYEAVGA
jgi:ABC-2 type transport system permease protein